jgi:8-oxo-dGTP pyrophosphatase MutT (NUDIX family)
MGEDVVRAAGGAVLRDRGGSTEVVLVHRPKYDDWTLPKGKAYRGESDEDCAVREVEEETGLRCELEGDPVDVSYRDSLGRPKVVHYWRMRPNGDALRPSREIDEARWLPLADADQLLTHAHDHEVLRALIDGR